MTAETTTNRDGKLAEQRYSAVLRALPMQIAVVDAHGTIVDVNEAWRSFSRNNNGLDRTAHGVDINYLAVCDNARGVDAEEAAAAAAGLRRILGGECAEFSLEYPCHSPYEQRWFMMTAAPLEESGGAVIAHMDITARRIAERELLASRQQLEQRIAQRTSQLAEALRQAESASIQKSRFLAAVSHDLGQPLQSIGLYLSVLGRQLTDPQALDICARISKSTAFMRELRDSMLNLDKLQSGTIKPQLQDIEVRHLLQRVASRNAPQAEKQHLRLRAYPSTHIVRSDPLLLQRIIENLVANALRYTKRGGVLIGCRRRGQRLRLEVWDTGIGIPSVNQEQIFDAYVQLRKPTETADKGTGIGLGLATVQEISRILAHPILVRSRVGQGSMFAVSVPLGTSQPSAAVGGSLPPRGEFVR